MKSWKGYMSQVMEVFRIVPTILLLVLVTYVLTPEVSLLT